MLHLPRDGRKRAGDEVVVVESTQRSKLLRARGKLSEDIDSFLQTCSMLFDQPQAKATGSWNIPNQCHGWILENVKEVLEHINEKKVEVETNIVSAKENRSQV